MPLKKNKSTKFAILQEETPRQSSQGVSSFVDDSLLSDQFYKKFGLTIRNARESAGLTQEDLSNRVGINRTYLSNIENGRRSLSLFISIRIAKELKIDMEEISNYI